MEQQYTLKKPDFQKERKRVGRGPSSGHGKTSCRGQKGQLSRSGAKKRVWFEGGQMPLQRRVPKRGFNNIFKKYFQLVNLSDLEKIDTPEITPELLSEKNVIDNPKKLVKVLGTGEIKKAVKITADAFSASAKKGIEAVGGEAIVRQKSK